MDAANWFIGLPVPAGVWFAALPPPPPRVRVFSSTDLHMTVAFLGPVGETAARRAFVHAAAWPLAAVEVVLAGVAPMGPARRPSAFSAVLEQPEPIAEAMAAVRHTMCEAAGARLESRPPLPHVTLARPSRKATREQRARAMAWARGLSLGRPRVRLDRLALYTWSEDRRTRLFDRVQERLLA